MSKQQSSMPDAPETPRHSGGSRKATPWVVWTKIKFRHEAHTWWRLGRYRTKEIAQTAAEKNSFQSVCEHRVMHESEGRPRQTEEPGTGDTATAPGDTSA